ncbi:MAG TPA: dihydroorotase [Actinomycetota bacterium]
MARWLFKGARVVDPEAGHDGVADVLVEDSLLVEVGSGLSAGAKTEVVDCDGLVLAPGLVDLHTHLREPGREDSETVETGSRAAALGGFTAVCAMPNTDPVADHLAVVMEVLARGDKAGLCQVLPAAAITKGLEGEQLVEMGELAAAGVRIFTDDHRGVQSSRVLRLALEYAKAFDVVVCQHPQDEALSEGAHMHEGHYSALLGVRGAPAEAESTMVARDIALARLTGGRLHVTHVSTAESARWLREGIARDVRVTADATPHHLSLIDAEVEYDTNRKMNPPLRTAEDRDALRAAVAEGVIGAIATDHAPHAVEDKEVEFDLARFGTTGLETALGVVLTDLVEPGVLSLDAAVRAMSTTPAGILGLGDHGSLQAGTAANLVVFDPAAEWVVGERPFASKGRNSAFLGRALRGRVVHTMLAGDLTVRDGEATR